MKTKMIILAMLFSTMVFAQKRDYKYFSIGTNYATSPSSYSGIKPPNELVFNFITEAGIMYDVFDISVRYEYADLKEKYHSFSGAVGIVLFQIGGRKFLNNNNPLLIIPGGKYGRIMREKKGGTRPAVAYYGFEIEFRQQIGKFFISVEPSLDKRNDVEDGIWRENVHFKLGYTF